VAYTTSSSKKKLIAIILIIIVISSLTLFVSQIINQFWFWISIILIAFIAYKIMPRMK